MTTKPAGQRSTAACRSANRKKEEKCATTVQLCWWAKKASLDGSTIVARDEDYDQGFNEKRFVYCPAKNYDELFVSKGTGVEIPLKGEGCGFPAVRDAVEDYGRFDEQGINSYNVPMSSTESEASNGRVFDGSQ